MDWPAIGAVADLIAAIAVVATLGYLAVQLRQNTAALRSNAAHGAHDQAAGIYDMLAGDAELADLFVRASQTPDGVTAIERARFFALMMAAFFRLQNWYLQAEARTMDRTLLESWSRLVGQHATTPGFKLFWAQRRTVFAPRFRAYLEEHVFLDAGEPQYSPLGAAAELGSAGRQN